LGPVRSTVARLRRRLSREGWSAWPPAPASAQSEGSRARARPDAVGLVLLARRAGPPARRLAQRGRLALGRLGGRVRAALPVVWTGLLVAACAGSAALLFASDVVNLRTIRAGEATLERATSGPFGAYLHAVAAVAIVALLLVGLRRGRPAPLAGIAACGLASLVLGLVAYLPAALSDGGWAQRYEGVSTQPGPGLWLGLAGSVLAITSALALLRNRSGDRRRPRRAVAGNEEAVRSARDAGDLSDLERQAEAQQIQDDAPGEIAAAVARI
jgi:hypothetical protein